MLIVVCIETDQDQADFIQLKESIERLEQQVTQMQARMSAASWMLIEDHP